MNKASERIQYIAEYISNYEAKIRALNKHGLYDNAVLFELFALEVSKLWFNKSFSNLNIGTSQFPIFDLVSEDNEIYIQVSTEKDTPAKIKKTLTKLATTSNDELKRITTAYFFVLSNYSEEKVKSFTGENRIGKVDFDAEINLISTNKILERANYDLEFQRNIYELLKTEEKYQKDIEYQLNKQVDYSKRHILDYTYLINDEYEIDRGEIIDRIKTTNPKLLMICGAAGSGKSALCRKLIENEPIILFARAESVAEVRNVDEIWDIDLARALKYVGNNRIVFFIDALEFIADMSVTKIDIIDELCYLANNSDNASLLMSCRSTDRAHFHKLEAKYNVTIETIDDLSDSDVGMIANHFPLIRKMTALKDYRDFLRSPLYVDMIVRHIRSVEDIKDINELRNIIWDEVMCLKNHPFPAGISSSDIKNAIKKIALTRAKTFVSGVSADIIDDRILKLLLSNGIIVEFNRKVRLKHDIFEDIFFERYIDKLFYNAKCNYLQFYDEIEKVGKCINRRYQIWVENKLLASSNRDKFLYSLLRSDSIPIEWKNNTIVGIVNSEYCADFFIEHKGYVINDGLNEFLHVINTSAYYAQIYTMNYSNYYTFLKPIGEGRRSLIRLIEEANIYKDNEFKIEIAHLCADYANSISFDKETAEAACHILEYYIDQIINNSIVDVLLPSGKEELETYLHSIYLMIEYSKDWVSDLLDKASTEYKSGRSNTVAEVIVEYTINNPTDSLACFLGHNLLSLASLIWLNEDKNNSNWNNHGYSCFERSTALGLSKNASNYSYNYRKADDNRFYCMLLNNNFKAALDWALKLTNHVSSRLMDDESAEKNQIEITYNGVTKSYIGNAKFWGVASEDPQVHELVDDTIFLLRKNIVDIINNDTLPNSIRVSFAEYVKQRIITNTNNIMMLSVLAYIGMHCRAIIPDYAIELLASPQLIRFDNQRVSFITPNPIKDNLKKEMTIAVGIPFLEMRYPADTVDYFSLMDYAIWLQIQNGMDLKERVEQIIDSLYVKYPECEEYAYENLTIQKIDIRKSKIDSSNKDFLIITPELTGIAANLIEDAKDSPQGQEEQNANALYNKVQVLLESDSRNTEKMLQTIEEVLGFHKRAIVPNGSDQILIGLIAYTLKNCELDIESRSRISSIWIDGIDIIIDNGVFLFNKGLLTVLFDQMYQELDESTELRLKKLALHLLMTTGYAGVVNSVRDQLIQYLKTHHDLGKKILSIITSLSSMMLAEGQLPDDKSVSMVLATAPDDLDIEVDRFISESNNELKAAALNCGMDLTDESFAKVAKAILIYILEQNRIEQFMQNSILGLSHAMRVFVMSLLDNDETAMAAIDFLFDDVNENLFCEENCQLYDDILGHISFMFFDAYNDDKKRELCKQLVYRIEVKLCDLCRKENKQRLSVNLLLPMKTYASIDWNKCVTAFSYEDKVFLGNMWSKYGIYHIKVLLSTVYSMHICELLPEILIPLNKVISIISKDRDLFRNNILNDENSVFVINTIISTSLVSFDEQISEDYSLSEAYESMLNSLIDFDYKEAAVILNDYRVH